MACGLLEGHLGEGRARLAAALAAACLACGCSSTRGIETPAGPHFSVLTYNVNWGAPRPDLALRAILDANADLVCLQETTPPWEEYLRPRLGRAYPHVQFRHYGAAGGQAVLSKVPVREIGYGRPKAGWFPGWVLEASTPVGAVQVLNVHLRPSVSERGSFSPSAYYSAKSVRLDEIRELHGRLDPKLPAVVLGDFNESDSGSAIQWLVERGMKDALREFDRSSKTWRWRTWFWTFRDRLDHVVYSADLHCFGAAVIKAGASDHLPLLAVFGKKPKSPIAPAPGRSGGT